MDTVMSALQSEILDLIARLKKAIEEADPASLDWQPGPETNSLAVLAMHSMGATEFLVATAVGVPIVRDRPSEFRTEGLDKATLLARVEEVEGKVRTWLAQAASGVLAEQRTVRDQQRSAAVLLVHAAAHLAEHVGHVELTSQLGAKSRAESAARGQG